MREAERRKGEETLSLSSHRSTNEGRSARRMMGAPNREGFRSIMSYGAIPPAIRRDFQWPIRFVQERIKDSFKIGMKGGKCVEWNEICMGNLIRLAC